MRKNRGMKRHTASALVIILALFLSSGTAFSQDPVPAAAAPATAPSEEAAISDDGSKITLDFKEADINTVLRVMSLKSNINIVAGPEVQGTVTIRLENVPWEKALEVVLRTYGYVYERDGNIIRVTTRDNLAQEPLVTQTYILNYSKAAEIQTSVQDMLTERGRVKISERTNTLVLTDIPTNLYSIGEVVKKLDRITPQAYIDSKIVKTDVAVTENLGIDWKTGGANNLGSLTGAARPVTFPFPMNSNGTNAESGANFLRQFYPLQSATTSDTTNTVDARSFPLYGADAPAPNFSYGTLSFSSFNAVLQLLKSRTNTKVISNPRIVVLNNQTAEIHVGDNIPLPKFETNSTTGRLNVSGFDYDKLKTGVELKVTPHINSADEILVDLQPSVNARGATITFNADLSAPIINETTAKTQLLIESGQTIAIGGLMTDSLQVDENKVPYLGDVPLVGKLFRSKRQTAGSGNEKVETLFFVTVTMVDTEGQRIEREKDSGNTAAKSAGQSSGQSASQTTEKKVKASAGTSSVNDEEEKANAPEATGSPVVTAQKTSDLPTAEKAAA